MPRRIGELRASSSTMVQAPPSSDSEDSQEDLRESGGVRDYQYESEGEELLGTGARALLHRARGDYRCKSFSIFISVLISILISILIFNSYSLAA